MTFSSPRTLPYQKKVGLVYLRLSLFYLQLDRRLVFVAYVELGWSFLLTVEIRFGHGGKSVWSFVLMVPLVRKFDFAFFAYGSPRPEIGFGLFHLRFPHRKQKTTNRKQKDLNCK